MPPQSLYSQKHSASIELNCVAFDVASADLSSQKKHYTRANIFAKSYKTALAFQICLESRYADQQIKRSLIRAFCVTFTLHIRCEMGRQPNLINQKKEIRLSQHDSYNPRHVACNVYRPERNSPELCPLHRRRVLISALILHRVGATPIRELRVIFAVARTR